MYHTQPPEIDLHLLAVVATLDFPDAEQCFEQFKMYRVKLRRPTDPTAEVEFGLSLTDAEGIKHYGWIKEEDRGAVELLLDTGNDVRLVASRLRTRWSQYDSHLGRARRFQEGAAMVQVSAQE